MAWGPLTIDLGIAAALLGFLAIGLLAVGLLLAVAAPATVQF
jgi:hypothetical protein